MYKFEVILMGDEWDDAPAPENVQWVKAECPEQIEAYYAAAGFDLHEVSIEEIFFNVSEDAIDLDLTIA